MRRFSFVMVAVAGGLLAISGVAQVQSGHFASDLKWVLHVDIKELSSSPTGTALIKNLGGGPLKGLESLKGFSGVDVLKDVDALVLAGDSATEDGMMAYAYGRFDVERISGIAGTAKGYKRVEFGNRNVLTWEDKGESMNLSFVNPGMMVLSRNKQLVEKAILRGTGVAQGKPAATLAAALQKKPGRLITLRTTEMGGLAKNFQQLKMLGQAEGAMLEVNQLQGENGVKVDLSMTSTTRETAQQLYQAAMGFQALMLINAAKNPDGAALAQGAAVKLDGSTLNASLKVPGDLLQRLIEVRMAEQGEAN